MIVIAISVNSVTCCGVEAVEVFKARLHGTLSNLVY